MHLSAGSRQRVQHLQPQAHAAPACSRAHAVVFVQRGIRPASAAQQVLTRAPARAAPTSTPQVQEAKSSRVQRVEGTVIAMAGTGSGQTMVVRRIFQGVGVELSIMLHSPVLSSVEVVRRGKVRRAKLYYLRELTGKSARLKEIFVTREDRAKAAAAAAAKAAAQ